MSRLLTVPVLALALMGFTWSSQPLPKPVRTQLKSGGFWHKGCPVSLSGLRLLTVSHYDFRHRTRAGQLVVNKAAVRPLSRVFRRLYAIRFPIRHMRFSDFYGPNRRGDPTASFECRQAVPSPCTGGTGTGTWSMHAYGLAVDLNPRENPYVGCGESRDPTAQSYRDRSRKRRGMVGGRTLRAFGSVGWGWGGSWSGNTKDYMHFSSTGH
jgi:hypothetical protein